MTGRKVMQLENEVLLLEVAPKGAELCRVLDKRTQREVLWNGDPAIWGRHSPILFPNVGKTFQNVARYGGKRYPTKQHGFARDMVFSADRQTEESLIFSLKSTPETKAEYPYEFVLKVAYTLHGNEIVVSWVVENTGEESMLFTIGAHPAFNVPQDYEFDFHELRELHYRLLDASGTALPALHPLPLQDGKCAFRAGMFDHDALIFDHQIKAVSLLVDGKPYITVVSPDFPSFGIWSKPGAPFVCLEPWQGRCDDYGFTGEMKDKRDIVALPPRGIFRKHYSIVVE